MNKRRIAALLMCVLLAFSGGCSLIDIDEEKAQAMENAKVLAEYKDTDITKQQVVQYMTQLYSQQGQSLDDLESSDNWSIYLNGGIEKLVIDAMCIEKAAELGLDQLTEDEKKDIDDQYNSTMDSLKSYAEYMAKAAVEDNSSLNYDEEYQKTLDDYFASMGYTEETLRSKMEREFIITKVYDYYIKDVAVSDDEVKNEYDTQVSIQQGNVENDPSFVEMQESLGSRVLVYPDGYMKVRHIYLAFDDETKTAATTAYGEDNTDEYNRLIEKGKAALQTKIDDIQSRLAAGEDFGALMEEYNEDTTYSSEPNSTEGTETGPYKSNTLPGYLDAVAKLTKNGDVSEPVVNYNGVYFIQCVKMLAGVVPYDDVKDDIKSDLLTTKQYEEWEKVTQGWIDDAKAAGTLKLYPERY